jgi:hypothetical protein
MIMGAFPKGPGRYWRRLSVLQAFPSRRATCDLDDRFRETNQIGSDGIEPTDLILRACDFIEVAAAMAAIFVESKPLS